MPRALKIIAVRPAAEIVPPSDGTLDDAMVETWLGGFTRSAHTRRGYKADAAAFRAFIGKPLIAVTGRDIVDFAASLSHLAPASQARRLSAVKSLVGLLRRQGLIPFDVAAAIQLPAIKDSLVERIMTEEAVQKLLWAAETPPPRFSKLGKRTSRFTQRNTAVLRLLYGTGMRISELCGLCWRDLTPRADGGQINIFGKGGKTRPVRLTRTLWDRMALLRGDAGPDDPVFRSREGGALDPSQVHRIFKEAVKRAKLPANISAHWLRHAHASHALTRGCPVHVVRSTLGHASLQTTTRYVDAFPDDSSGRYLTA